MPGTLLGGSNKAMKQIDMKLGPDGACVLLYFDFVRLTSSAPLSDFACMKFG